MLSRLKGHNFAPRKNNPLAVSNLHHVIDRIPVPVLIKNDSAGKSHISDIQKTVANLLCGVSSAVDCF